MEAILQSGLLADAVAEEQRKAPEHARRRSADSDCDFRKPAERAPSAAGELRLREQALRDREKALKEREERLEREALILAFFLACITFKAFAKNDVCFKRHIGHEYSSTQNEHDVGKFFMTEKSILLLAFVVTFSPQFSRVSLKIAVASATQRLSI